MNVISKIKDIEVRVCDLNTLNGTNWLNDKVRGSNK